MGGPTSSLPLGIAKPGRQQSQAAGRHFSDHMPVGIMMNKETSRAEKGSR